MPVKVLPSLEETKWAQEQTNDLIDRWRETGRRMRVLQNRIIRQDNGEPWLDHLEALFGGNVFPSSNRSDA